MNIQPYAVTAGTAAERRPRVARLAHSGILAIPVGCLLALAVMPLSTSGEGALMFSAWLLAAGLLTGMVAAVITNGPGEVFRAEHLVLVGVIVVIFPELLQPSYSTDLPVEIVRKTFVAIGLFGTCFAFGSSLYPGRLPKTLTGLASRHYSSRTATGIMVACWILAMFSYFAASKFSLSTLADGLMEDRFGAAWARGQLGDWSSFRDFLTYFGYPLPTLTVLIKLRERSWSRPNVLAGLICSLTFLPFQAQGGGRRVVVLIVGAAIMTWLVANRHHLKVRHCVGLAVVCLVTVIVLDVMLAQRKQMLRDFSYDLNDFKGLRVDDNFDTLGTTVRIFPEELDYLQHKYLWYTLVRPIPRALWEGKPINGGFDLATYQGQRGVSLANTIVGELYMSYGWTAVAIGGVLMGWVARKWSQLLDVNHGPTGLALYCMGTMCLFIGVRSMLELVLMSYPILCWWAIDWSIYSRVKPGATRDYTPHVGVRRLSL